MKILGIRSQKKLGKAIKRIYELDGGRGLLVTGDKVVCEFSAFGQIQPLAEKPQFAGSPFQQALRPRGQPWDSRGLALRADRSALFIADCGWSVERCYLEACLLDLNGAQQPVSRCLRDIPSARSDQDPFFFLNEARVGVIMYEGLCVNMDARDLTIKPTFDFITKEFSPPILWDSLFPHPGGFEFSFGMGDPGHGVYRRIALAEKNGNVFPTMVDEAVFEGRADLWATVPSPSGTYGFVLLLKHEIGMVLPGGPAANSVQDLGEVIRVGAGRTERISVRGNLEIDFGIVEAQLLTPARLPPEAYRFYPKDPKNGPPAVLCPISDEIVLYPTPGGTLLEVDFRRQEVRELTRLGFPVQAMRLLSPAGPLAVAGGEGQFLILDVEP